MVEDFCNFFILYAGFCFSFALAGSFNFNYRIKAFSCFQQSMLSVVNISIGQYDLMSEETKDIYLYHAFVIIQVVLFKFLILNLIVAVLSNTYRIF